LQHGNLCIIQLFEIILEAVEHYENELGLRHFTGCILNTEVSANWATFFIFIHEFHNQVNSFPFQMFSLLTHTEMLSIKMNSFMDEYFKCLHYKKLCIT